MALLAAQDLSSKDIAERLFVSARTVDNHLQRVYTKLGVSGRSQLAERLAATDVPADRAPRPAEGASGGQSSASRAGKPPRLIGPHRSMVTRSSTLPWSRIARRYSSQSGCSPLIDR